MAMTPLKEYQGLRPYQQEDVQWLAPRRFAFLLLEQRMGKSAVAIRAADVVGARNVVVVCPALVRAVWPEQFKLWGTKSRLVHVFSYDYFSRGGTFTDPIDILILDEGQYLKSPVSQRTKAIYGKGCSGKGLVSQARQVWVLSGTLTPNGVHELYPHLRALVPGATKVPTVPSQDWSSEPMFTEYYCHTHFDMRLNRRFVHGAKKEKIPELRTKFLPHVRRRTIHQVMKDFPRVSFNTVPLTISAAERKHLKTHEPDSAHRQAMLDALETGDKAKMASEAAVFTKLRRHTGMAKTPAAAEWVKEELENNPKLKMVVFAHHADVVSNLQVRLQRYKPAVITGKVTHADREDALKRFRLDPDCRVFIGNILACSTGIDLSAASDIAFVEQSWTPSDNAQAAARCTNLETKQPVTVTMLTISDSFDHVLGGVLARKCSGLNVFWNPIQTKGELS